MSRYLMLYVARIGAIRSTYRCYTFGAILSPPAEIRSQYILNTSLLNTSLLNPYFLNTYSIHTSPA